MGSKKDVRVIMVGRWNFEKHCYEPWLISGNAALTKPNLDDMVDCCECGKKVRIGDTYTSLRVHNTFGLGYAVCDKCYEKEWEERRKYSND